MLFVVDEAHKFCPEKGEGESEAKEMMLSLASDGRKYGFCAVFATQRLSKLDKSAASELTNVLIGPTFMDIDLQRAHRALGIIPRDQAAFNEQMKTMAPGHFGALGRAISKTRLLVKVGAIQTTHPTAGSGKYSAEPPPPPEKVKALLPSWRICRKRRRRRRARKRNSGARSASCAASSALLRKRRARSSRSNLHQPISSRILASLNARSRRPRRLQ